jgi:hypothetical protein
MGHLQPSSPVQRRPATPGTEGVGQDGALGQAAPNTQGGEYPPAGPSDPTPGRSRGLTGAALHLPKTQCLWMAPLCYTSAVYRLKPVVLGGTMLCSSLHGCPCGYLMALSSPSRHPSQQFQHSYARIMRCFSHASSKRIDWAGGCEREEPMPRRAPARKISTGLSLTFLWFLYRKARSGGTYCIRRDATNDCIDVSLYADALRMIVWTVTVMSFEEASSRARTWALTLLIEE